MGKGSTKTTSSYSPPQYVSDAVQGLISRAQGVSQNPLTPYGGQQVADLTANQQGAFNTFSQYGGANSPFLQQAAQYANMSGAPAYTGIQNYLNPYQDQVVNSTMGNLDRNDAMQRQAQKTSMINSGSWGGDRAGVAAGELARGQNMARGSTLANLNNQNYNQALTASQNDLTRYGNTAYTYGGLNNLVLQGAGAQAQAGALEQGQNQAQLDVPYQNYLQQQADPYQRTQWLASILGAGAGAAGGTTTQTQPGPSGVSQALGAGTSLASMYWLLSDKRAKEDIEPIGKTFDGQTISRYRYKGDPKTQIGLIAQDVEKTKPEAVKNMGGMKMLDYRQATEKAASLGEMRYSVGGAVQAPWERGRQIIPQNQLQPMQARPPEVAPMQRGNDDYGAQGISNLSSIMQMVKKKGAGSPMQVIPERFGMSTGLGQMATPTMNSNNLLPPIYKHGGAVRKYANGGFAFDNDPTMYDPSPLAVGQSAMDQFSLGDLSSAQQPLRQQDIDGRMSDAEINTAIPPSYGQQELTAPPTTQQPVQVAQNMQGAPMSDAPQAGFGSMPMYGDNGMPDTTVEPMDDQDKGLAILAAGLGMMGGQSPYAGVNIGQGGLAGVKTWQSIKEQKRKERDDRLDRAYKEKYLQYQLKNLEQSATRQAEELDIKRDTLEQGKWTAIAQTPDGKGIIQQDGKTGATRVMPIEGGVGSKVGSASAANLNDQTLTDMAQQYLAGDKSVLTNLGRGTQGAANIVALRERIADEARSQGMSPREIAIGQAEFSGLLAGERTLGTRSANIEMANNEAKSLIPLALDASNRVDRTNFPNLNAIILAGEKGVGDEDVVQMGVATNSLINVYARAISPQGVPTVSDKEHAREILENAWSKGQYASAVKQMQKEIEAARLSPQQTKQQMRENFSGKEGGSEKGATAIPTRPPALPAGSQYSPSRKQWRTPQGAMFDESGAPIQ